VERVVQLSDGSYVVHVIKSDGSEVHVAVSAGFKVTGQEAGPGRGGPQGGWHHGGPDGDGNGGPGGSTGQTSNASMGV
jgi:hypothetical protein